jgi:hypothetical protein
MGKRGATGAAVGTATTGADSSSNGVTTVGVDAVHRMVGEPAGTAHGRAEEGTLAAVADVGNVDIGI